MQVTACDGLVARCRDRTGEHIIDMSLVGTPAPGTWVMVFLGAAREVISEQAARATTDALLALEMALRGETGFDHLFADLVGREPQLPEHLKKQA